MAPQRGPGGGPGGPGIARHGRGAGIDSGITKKAGDTRDMSGEEPAQQAGARADAEPIVPVELPADAHFDLDTYAALYTGHTRIQRLLFIARRCPQLQADAYRRALDEIKGSTLDTALLKTAAAEAMQAQPEGGFVLDEAWVEKTEQQAQAQHEKLQTELNNYKTHLIKESIRMGLNDLGRLAYRRGDLVAAIKYYARTRDYCTTGKHIVSMCMEVIRISIEQGVAAGNGHPFTNVSTYVNKAEQTGDTLGATQTAQLNAASAIALLHGAKYRMAARKFLAVGFELGTAYNDVIAPQDIAIYGGLCALATFSRSEIKTKVLESANARQFLELVPEIRECVRDFYASKYSSCLAYLDKLLPDLQLDMYLHAHVKALYKKIRIRALVQYFSPFLSVDLSVMARAFNTEVSLLETELIDLIATNQIAARIDSHSKVLYARHSDERAATFKKVTAMGDDFQRQARALLLRATMQKNGVTVKHGGGGSGRGASAAADEDGDIDMD